MQTKSENVNRIEEAVLGLAACHSRNSKKKLQFQTSNGQPEEHVTTTGRRYVDQASLIHILVECHSASLAEEVTWAPLPPALIESVENYPYDITDFTHTRTSPFGAGREK